MVSWNESNVREEKGGGEGEGGREEERNDGDAGRFSTRGERFRRFPRDRGSISILSIRHLAGRLSLYSRVDGSGTG